jgi:3D (Asp-Asp-Asp) domain-containing protein
MKTIKRYKLIWIISSLFLLAGCSEIIGVYASSDDKIQAAEKVTKYSYGNAVKVVSEQNQVADTTTNTAPTDKRVLKKVYTLSGETKKSQATKNYAVDAPPTIKTPVSDDSNYRDQGYKRITFYTSRATAKTASGKQVSRSAVAAGKGYKFGTRIMIDWNKNGKPDDRVMIVLDRGSAVGNNTFDVWVPSRGDIPRAGVLKRKVWVIS